MGRFSVYFCSTLYMFQTGFQSIIMSSKLHIQRHVFVIPKLLSAASLARLAADVFKRQMSCDMSVCTNSTPFYLHLPVLSFQVAPAHVYLTRPTSRNTILTHGSFLFRRFAAYKEGSRINSEAANGNSDAVVLRSFKEWKVFWSTFLSISRKDSISKNCPKEKDLPPTITW